MAATNDDLSVGNRPLFFRWSENNDARANRVRRGEEGFNDLPFYRSLCGEEGCIRVDLHRIICRHNDFSLGLQAVYRLTFRDGTTSERSAPFHESRLHESPYYSVLLAYGWRSEGRSSSCEVKLSLDEGERLVGLRLNQCGIVDGIHFITTHRTVFFGGNSGHRIDLPFPRRHQRIVAFAGIKLEGGLGRIGCFAVDDAWACRGPLVMLRWLYAQGRASPLPVKGKMPHGPPVMATTCDSSTLLKQKCLSPLPLHGTQNELAVQALICLEPDDIWQNIVSYI